MIERAHGDARWLASRDRAVALDPELGGRAARDPRLADDVDPPPDKEQDFMPNATIQTTTGLFRDPMKPRLVEAALSDRDPAGPLVLDLPRGTEVQVLGSKAQWVRVRTKTDAGTVEGWVLRRTIDLR